MGELNFVVTALSTGKTLINDWPTATCSTVDDPLGPIDEDATSRPCGACMRTTQAQISAGGAPGLSACNRSARSHDCIGANLKNNHDDQKNESRERRNLSFFSRTINHT